MKVSEFLAPLQHQATPNRTDFSKLGQDSSMQTIRCDNCGSHAERHYLLNSQLIRTECPKCDSLRIICSRTGKVVEDNTIGIYV
jgi:phage FluMu protein Com